LAALAPAFAQVDFDAVRASAPRIRNVFGLRNDWPASDLTFEQNCADLARHEEEFNRGVAFAYALLDPEGESYLGCLYIKPIKSRLAVDWRKARFQAQAFFWLSDAASGLSAELVLSVLSAWLHQVWPFAAVAFPGRVQAWPEWEALAFEVPRLDSSQRLDPS